MNRRHGLVVVALGVVLAGCASGGGGGTKPPNEIRIAVTEKGFEPNAVGLVRGEPATLLVTRKTDQTCATEMVFEDGTRHALPLNQVVRIEVPVARPDTLRYACPMNMYTGMIVTD